MDFEFVKSSLSAEGFDVVYDINGMAYDYLCTPSHLPSTTHQAQLNNISLFLLLTFFKYV